MLTDIFLLIFGLGLLYFGGDFLVLGCIRISRIFKISPFIIGATVMGFGTSAPELAVSTLAALKGSPELALGNIVGSNIANMGLVLGLTALITPLIIAPNRLKESLPYLLVSTFLLLIFTWDNYLSRVEGAVMAFGLVVYLWRILSRRDEEAVELEEDDGKFFPKAGVAVQSILVIVGLIFLVLGADLMIMGGVNIARTLGVSEWLIGISIIAIGTSLPEIVSSTMSAKHGHGEMALGNIFGSNIFNILMVLGTTAMIAPLRIIDKIHPDLLITTGLTCLLLIMIRMGHKLSKVKGVILLVCYFFYMGLKSSGMI